MLLSVAPALTLLTTVLPLYIYVCTCGCRCVVWSLAIYGVIAYYQRQQDEAATAGEPQGKERRTEGRMDGWMEGWMHGWMDVSMHVCQ